MSGKYTLHLYYFKSPVEYEANYDSSIGLSKFGGGLAFRPKFFFSQPNSENNKLCKYLLIYNLNPSPPPKKKINNNFDRI